MSNSRPVNVDLSVDSPKILLDAENSVFLIDGASYPEDANDVYNCVLDWLKQNNYRFEKELVCNFKFKVLSSASRKLIFEILLGLEKAHFANGKVKIQWYYDEYDEDMMEVGEDFSETVNVPFKILQYSF